MKRVALCLFLLLGFSAAANAEMFTAYLTSAQEVPATASNARGFARIHVNEDTGTVTWLVVFNGLTSDQTGAHIHAPAPIGANAGVAINLGTPGGTSGTISGSGPITPTQIQQLREHLAYVNVHSANFPAGEIRGQLGVRRPVDYDGDGRTDPSVLRFPSGSGVLPITYWNLNSTAGVQTLTWGDANRDFPAPGDFEGDGRDDFSLYREGATAGAQSEFWVVLSTDLNIRYWAWGVAGDEQIPRDYDGDGRTDIAVFRPGPSAGTPANWYILQSGSNTVRIEQFGTTGNGTTSSERPVPGDYDGDGKFDIAVYRWGIAPTNTYIIKYSSTGQIVYRSFGNFQTDYILPGDYDGDGKYDLAVARTGAAGTSPLVWWILQSSTGTSRTQTFGISSDLPVQGDYDGDARTDIAVYRRGAAAGAQSNFWIFRSFDNTAQVIPWGLGADFPVNVFDAR